MNLFKLKKTVKQSAKVRPSAKKRTGAGRKPSKRGKSSTASRVKSAALRLSKSATPKNKKAALRAIAASL